MGMESGTNVGWPHITGDIYIKKLRSIHLLQFPYIREPQNKVVFQNRSIKYSLSCNTLWPCTQAHGRDSVVIDEWPEALINNGGDAARVNPEQRSGRRWISGIGVVTTRFLPTIYIHFKDQYKRYMFMMLDANTDLKRLIYFI